MKCLYCYKNNIETEQEYHAKCSRRIFGSNIPPVFEFKLSDIKELAKQAINRSLSITGVQKKISLDISKKEKKDRLTIVGLWGDYILKPPEADYPEMPELEDLTMHLAQIADIETPEHSLIRFKTGELAYIIKRFDRQNKQKIAVEDFCQLTENLTEQKYNGASMEKIAKFIVRYSDYTGLDLIKFFNNAVFSFLTGNADMHLKNYSLITENEKKISPSYDLLPTKLLMPSDTEEMALTLNGKKKKLKRKDFFEFGNTIGLDLKVLNNELQALNSKFNDLLEFINSGYIKNVTKEKYKDLMKERAMRLGFDV